MTMVIFALTSGRSGTHYLKDLFANNVADCTARHEPYLDWGNPTLFGRAIDDAEEGHLDRIRALLTRKKQYLERLPTRLYIEASHVFLKSAYVAAIEFFPEMKLIHLIRDPLAVAKSEANREHFAHTLHFPFRYYCANDGKRYFRWSLTGKEAIFQCLGEQQLSRFQRYLIQWIEIEHRAMRFLDQHHKHESCFTLHSPEDLNNPERLRQLFDSFSLSLKHETILMCGRKNTTPYHPTRLTAEDEREFRAVLETLPAHYLAIFTRPPYTQFEWAERLRP